MSAAAPWDNDPIDTTAVAAMRAGGGASGSSDRPLTIRGPAGQQARPVAPPAAPQPQQPSSLQGAGMAASATPWDDDPADTSAHTTPTWLSRAGDLAQSAATGIEKGAIGLATLPVTLAGWGQAATSSGMDLLLGPKPAVPAAAPGSLDDVARNTGNYLSVAGAERAADAMGVPFYQPQSTAGRYAETVGEFLPGATGGGLMGALKYGVAPGLASEAAGQATQGTAAEPYARAIAPILAGGVAGLVGGPGSAGKVLRDAAGPLDQDTIAKAQDLMDTAKAYGAPIGLAEAVQQVTNSGTRLGSLQRVVEQSRGGADTMAKFYADRPQQVQQAGNAAIDQVGPVPAVPFDGSTGPVRPNPSAVGPAVQQAAQGALDVSPQGQAASQALAGAGARITPEQAGQVIQPALGGVYDQRLAARSAQARQDYAVAGSDTVSPDAINGIIDGLNAQIRADKTGLLAKPLGDFRDRLIDRTARPQSREWVPDHEGGAPTGSPDRGFAPPDTYEPRLTGMRPPMPRPTSLVNFLQSAGGVRDPGGDLKAMGLDRFPGLVRTSGGLSPDMARQAAAQAGYLGPDIDHAMANTTPNDLFDALDRHPHYSVLDDDAVHAWEVHDAYRADRDRSSGPVGYSAAPPRAPGLPDGGMIGETAPAQRTPITDIENLNRARKYTRDLIDRPQVDPRSIDKETAARLGPALQDLDAAMTEGSPAYRQANENFQRNSVPLQPFEHTPALAGAIELDPYSIRYLMAAHEVPGAIDRGGASAARAFVDVAPGPARQAYERHVTTRLLDQATGSSGRVEPDRLARAVRDNADVLRQLPAVQQRVQAVIDTQRALAPLGDTLVGKLAATPSFREQAALVLSPSPVAGSASEVGDAVRQIAAQSPDAARALVSQRIRQVFDEATQNNMGGPNQWGGAKFNAVIRGNTQQARNLKAAVEALHGPGVWRDFQKTLDVFEAMGRRQAPGSQTEFNKQFTAELSKGGKVGSTVAAVGSPTKILGKASELYEGWKYGRNTQALAVMLTRPDAARALGAIAKHPPGSAASEGAAAMYLLSASANQGRKAIAR